MIGKNTIGAAVVGTGFIGTVHLQTLRRMGVHVTGVLGSSLVRGQLAADALNVKKAYTSLDELLDDSAVQVVHVTSPNQYHFEQVKQILASGRHVICEKPLTMTSSESKELMDLATRSDLITAVNYNVRFYPLNRHAQQMVAEGELGDVRLVSGHYLQDWLLFDTDWNWRLDADKGGPLRAVSDIGTHWIDLTSNITGLKVTEVMAELSTFISPRMQPKGPVETFSNKSSVESVPTDIATDDTALLLFRYSNGARGSVVVSQISPGRKNSLHWQIDGSKESASWNSETPDNLWLGRRNEPNGILHRDATLMNEAGAAAASLPGGHVEGFADSFFALFTAVYQALEATSPPVNPPYATFADGHYEMQVCDAVLLSAKEQRWVSVG